MAGPQYMLRCTGRAELQYYKKTIERQTEIIEKLRLQLESEILEKVKQQQIIDDLIAKTEDAQAKAEVEGKKRIEAEKAKERQRQEGRGRLSEWRENNT